MRQAAVERETLKQLFHREFSRMVAVIGKLYGLSNIHLAEDVVSDTFLQAAETWEAGGMPENPEAWLYVVAKRKALQHFRRKKIFDDKISPELELRREEMQEPDFSVQNIRDSRLQMLFAVCHPAIASEAQIGLALRVLCGFGIDEIAEAFLTNKETVNKRLYRARKKLRTENVRMELPPEEELSGRLDNVLRIIYLLFNEGYYSKTRNRILRKDLCLEAMRLGLLLTEHEETDRPKTDALVALMCFHASRFGARRPGGGTDTDGEGDDDPDSDSDMPGTILYDRQDEALWDAALIRQGMRYLERSARGGEMSPYHLEARIAGLHCVSEDTREKWEEILGLYDRLVKLNYTPSAALNRVYALYKAKGARAALPEAEKLGLEDNHFYFVLLGELYGESNPQKAKSHFEKARSLAKTRTEKRIIGEKIEELSGGES